MHALMRMVLRPGLLSTRAPTHASAAAAVTAATGGPAAQGSPRPRHWSSSSSGNEEALRKAERMVELMGQSPQLQQMMLGVMPAPMRNPEVLKQLFGDPGMRRRIAEMIASRGLTIPDHLLERMNPASMDDTFARAQRLGLDPGALFSRLMSHPGLLAALQQPRVMAAFLDIAEDPARQAKYEGDKELLEVVFKVREIMGTAKPAATPAGPSSTGNTIPVSSTVSEVPSGASSGASGSSSPAGAAAARAAPPPPGQPPRAESGGVEEAGRATASSGGSSDAASASSSGVASTDSSGSGGSSTAEGAGYNPLVALMSSDPKAARWLQNPQVMAALQEVHKSPWKTVKYVFNREVMEAFSDLKKLLGGQKL